MVISGKKYMLIDALKLQEAARRVPVVSLLSARAAPLVKKRQYLA